MADSTMEQLPLPTSLAEVEAVSDQSWQRKKLKRGDGGEEKDESEQQELKG